jgi:hypothetical protein
MLRRLWFALRRHLARIDPIEDLSPVVCIRARLEIARKLVDPHIPFDLGGAMTTGTVLLKKSLEGICSKSGGGRTQANSDGQGSESHRGKIGECGYHWLYRFTQLLLMLSVIRIHIIGVRVAPRKTACLGKCWQTV